MGYLHHSWIPTYIRLDSRCNHEASFRHNKEELTGWIIGGIVFVALLILCKKLCDITYVVDEAMGMQEWQVSDEDRMKGYTQKGENI